MAKPHAISNQVVSLAPLGPALADTRTQALIKARQLEVVRIVLRQGETLREHSVPGEITVQCLEGRMQVQTSQGTQTMRAGDWVHLAGGEPHALVAEEDGSALVTICLTT